MKNINSLIAVLTTTFLLATFSLPALSESLTNKENLQGQTTKKADSSVSKLFDLSLEELGELTVTSVSRKKEKISDTAAAIFVLNSDDIRRSGANSIPEALRLIPGLQVARVGSSSWAISARGFNDFFSNKLLVMIDGRTVYTPVFSGVYWDIQDVMLEDIDRIEVIRGPGASVWGANAVNGVINILTKSSNQTKGSLVSVGAGNEEQFIAAARHGFSLNQKTDARVYAKAFSRDSSAFNSEIQNEDQWEQARAGFRLDSKPTENRKIQVQADTYVGNHEEGVNLPVFMPPFIQRRDEYQDVDGTNFLASWQETYSDGDITNLQFFYDRISRRGVDLSQDRHTFDIEFQHQTSIAESTELVWGTGYRHYFDDTEGSFATSFTPRNRDFGRFNAFAQVEQGLFDNRASLTLGTKVEYNDFTNFEIQPTARFRYTINETSSIWTSVSRAVRTPSRFDHDARVNFLTRPDEMGNLTVFSIFGDQNVDSEELTAYEIGYRNMLNSYLKLDVSAFFNEYDNLVTIEGGRPFLENTPAPPHLVIPSYFDNKGSGSVYGTEVVLTADIKKWWRVYAWYSYLQMELSQSSSSTDTFFSSKESESPEHQFAIRSQISIGENYEVDSMLRYVDRLSATNIPSYFELVLRLGWNISDNLELSLVGQNLIDSRHAEFTPAGRPIDSAQIERSFFIKSTYRF